MKKSLKLSFPIFTTISCSSNSEKNQNQDIKLETKIIAINNSNEYFTNRTYIFNSEIKSQNSLAIPSTLYYEWKLNNQIIQSGSNQANKRVEISTQKEGKNKLEFNVYSSFDKKIKYASDNYEFVVQKDKTPEKIQLSVSISSNANKYYLNKSYTFSSNVKSSNSLPVPSPLFYEWYLNDILVKNGNEIKSVNLNLNKLGTNKLEVKIYQDSSRKNMYCFNSFSFNVEEENTNPTEPLTFPSDEELMIVGKPLKNCNYVFERKLNKQQTLEKLNEYGVLRTFSLVTKIYANSQQFFNTNSFDDIKIELLENKNYDLLKFKITGIAKTNLSKWGRFPFAGLIEGWAGAEIKQGQKVEVIFTYTRSNISNVKKENKFDLSKVTLGGQSLSGSIINWNQLPFELSKLDLPFMTDFGGSCQIKVNNSIVKDTTNDNRVFFAFIYNFKNEYSTDNKDIYMVCDNKSYS